MATADGAGKLKTGAGIGLPKVNAARIGAALKAGVRDPLFAFLIVGGGFFAAYAAVEAGRKPPVHYSTEVKRALVDEFQTLAGRKPTAADEAKMEKDFVTDELLFREAIDRGMHLTDGATRKRLIDKVRYLIAGAPAEPTEEQIVNHYSENLTRYRAEPKTSFSQIFFSAEPKDPAGTLAALNRGDPVAGDDFWLGRHYPRYGDSMVRGIFGQPFIETLAKAPIGQWIGPVRTPRGWHFVRKDEAIASALMPYSEIRDQVRQDYMMAETEGAIDREIATLREKYDVRIDR